jgi:hypothetical protein
MSKSKREIQKLDAESQAGAHLTESTVLFHVALSLDSTSRNNCDPERLSN